MTRCWPIIHDDFSEPGHFTGDGTLAASRSPDELLPLWCMRDIWSNVRLRQLMHPAEQPLTAGM